MPLGASLQALATFHVVSQTLKQATFWEFQGVHGKAMESARRPGRLRRASGDPLAILESMGLLALPLAFPWTLLELPFNRENDFEDGNFTNMHNARGTKGP